MTFINYLNDYRLNYAKKMLKARRLKIIDVAEISGFGDATYFNRIFKQKTGMTPTEYLDRLQVIWIIIFLKPLNFNFYIDRL